jgi:peptidoglycan/xylan/chitin deacetylase (PgdA/CDA1 family)
MGTRKLRIALVAGLAVATAALTGCAAPGASPGQAGRSVWVTGATSRPVTPSATASGSSSGGGASVKSPGAPVGAALNASSSTSTGTGSTSTGTGNGGGPTKVKPKPPAPKRAARFNGPAYSATRTGGAGVALTFDDGPDPAQTPQLLDLLARYHVHATFCLVGQNVAAHPELVRRIVAEGHTLCNHTWQHSLTLGKQTPAQIRADLQRTNDAIHAAAPGSKIEYLRAPGGNFTPNFVAVATDLGMTSIYWQVDPRDWDHPTGESDTTHRARVIAAVKQHVHKGSIVLSHDYAQPDTIAAYRTLLPWLKHHYTLVALPTV